MPTKHKIISFSYSIAQATLKCIRSVPNSEWVKDYFKGYDYPSMTAVQLVGICIQYSCFISEII